MKKMWITVPSLSPTLLMIVVRRRPLSGRFVEERRVRVKARARALALSGKFGFSSPGFPLSCARALTD